MNAFEKPILRSTFGLFACILMSFIPSSNSEYTVAICADAVAVGDLDLDGNTDVVVTNTIYSIPEWTGFSFLMNQGGCNFSFTDSVYHYGIREFINIENLDTDPHPEMIFAEGRNIGIVFNNQLNDTLILKTGSHYIVIGMAIGDINNDGLKDIVYILNQDQKWGCFFNNGNKTFSNAHLYSIQNYFPVYIATGDLNSDGRDDIVITGQNTEIYYSIASGFQKVVLKENSLKNYVSVVDLNLDGKADIFTLDREIFPVTTFQIYKNLGNGSFDTIPSVNLPFGTYKCSVLDLNGDTFPDLLSLLSGLSGYVIYYNLGNFQFGNPQYIPVPYLGEFFRNFYCGDIDGNHCPDLITTRKTDQKITNVSILYNDGHGNFGPDPFVSIDEKPSADGILRCYPNPFQSETNINFNIPGSAFVNLSIYDLEGKLINCLINQYLKGGTHSIKWRRLDTNGKSCKPGAYIIYLTVNGQTCRSTKIIVY